MNRFLETRFYHSVYENHWDLGWQIDRKLLGRFFYHRRINNYHHATTTQQSFTDMRNLVKDYIWSTDR